MGANPHLVEPFSDSYFLVPAADIEPYPGEHVVAPRDFVHALSRHVVSPLVKVGEGGHYWLRHEWGIPPRTVAVPEEVYSDDEDQVLLARDSATAGLLQQGIVEPP